MLIRCQLGTVLPGGSVGSWWDAPFRLSPEGGGGGMCPRTVSPTDGSPSAAGCGAQAGVPKPVPGGAQVGTGVWDRGRTHREGAGVRVPVGRGLALGCCSGCSTGVGNGGDFTGETEAGESSDGDPAPWGTLPSTHGTGCNLGGCPSRGGESHLWGPAQRRENPTPSATFWRRRARGPGG